MILPVQFDPSIVPRSLSIPVSGTGGGGGGGGVGEDDTIRLNVVIRETPADFTVLVRGYVPTGVETDVLMTKVCEQVSIQKTSF